MSSVRLLLQRTVAATVGAQRAALSTKSTATGTWGLVDKVALTNDRTTFVAWHPKPDFPYEHSRPIPRVELRDRSAVIKETSISTAMQAFHIKHPELARQELSRVTFTTRHRWFPRSRDKKAKKTPMEREYL